MNTITRHRTISTDVKNVLASCTCNGNALTLPAQLDRRLYVATNEVLEALGGKWVKKAKAHLFDDADAADLVEQVLLTGTFTKSKQDFGFFETPDLIGLLMMAAANPKDGMSILEPEAGTGALAMLVLEACRPSIMACYDIQARNVEKLTAKIAAATADWAMPNRFPVFEGDFLNESPTVQFDRVIMNPPFAKRADIAHIRHAWKFLKPGGRLVSIASASVGFRTDKLAVDFRSFVNQHGDMEPMPDGSFKESGTMINTVMIVIDKPAA